MSLVSNKSSEEIRKYHINTRKNFLFSFSRDIKELYEKKYLDREQIEVLEHQILEIYTLKE